MELLDPVYIALITFRRREYETCIDVCTGILDRNPYDEAVWSLKTRALTAQVPISIPLKASVHFLDLPKATLVPGS